MADNEFLGEARPGSTPYTDALEAYARGETDTLPGEVEEIKPLAPVQARPEGQRTLEDYKALEQWANEPQPVTPTPPAKPLPTPPKLPSEYIPGDAGTPPTPPQPPQPQRAGQPYEQLPEDNLGVTRGRVPRIPESPDIPPPTPEPTTYEKALKGAPPPEIEPEEGEEYNASGKLITSRPALDVPRDQLESETLKAASRIPQPTVTQLGPAFLPQRPAQFQRPGPTPPYLGSVQTDQTAPRTSPSIIDQIDAAARDKARADALLQEQYGGGWSQLEAGLEGLARGASLGASDPVLAAIKASAKSTFGDQTFSDAYAEARKEIDLTAAANPWTAGITNVAGAIIPTLAAGPLGAGGAAATGAATVARGAAAASELSTLARIGAAARAGGTATIGAVGIPSRVASGAGIRLATRVMGEGAAKKGIGAATAAGAIEGAVEGLTGGAFQASLEALRPGYTAKQAAEDAVSQGATGGGLGGVLGAIFGSIGGAIGKTAGKLDEAAKQAKPTPLPEVKDVKLGAKDARDAAERMGQSLEAPPEAYVTSKEEYFANDQRPRFDKLVYQVGLSKEGGYDEILERESRAMAQGLTRVLALRDQLADKIGIAAKKAANAFDEADAAPLFPERVRAEAMAAEQARQAEAAAVAAQRAQAAATAARDQFPAVLDSTAPVAAARPIRTPLEGTPEGVAAPVSALEGPGLRAADELTAGQLAEPPHAYEEPFTLPQASDQDLAMMAPPGAVDDFAAPTGATTAAPTEVAQEVAQAADDVTRVLDEAAATAKGAPKATATEAPPEYVIPEQFARAQALQPQFEEQVARIRAKATAHMDFLGNDVLVNQGDAAAFRKLMKQLDAEEANINRALSQGRIGEAYGIFDQGIKAYIGKLVRSAKSSDGKQFFRDLSVEPMHWLEGTDAANNFIPTSPWQAAFVDARPAIDRALKGVERIRKSADFESSPQALEALNLTLAEMQGVKARGQVNAWMSDDYKTALQKDLQNIVGDDALWELTDEAAIATRAELQHLLADGDVWEAFPIGTRQFMGNKPWSRQIGIENDAAWQPFTSEGPRRADNLFDNVEEANSAAIDDLASNAGKPSHDRKQQAFLMNIRAMAADADARSHAWAEGGHTPESVQITNEVLELERRLQLVTEARFDKEAGDDYLAGAPASERAAQTIAGVAATLSGHPFVGTAIQFGALDPKTYERRLVEAVAEAQRNSEATIGNFAQKLATKSKRGHEVYDEATDAARRAAVYGQRLMHEKEVKRKLDEAKALTDHTSDEAQALIERGRALETVAPELADEYVALEERRAAYVTGQAPPDGRMDPSSMRKARAVATSAYTPEKTLARMADGVASHYEVEALKAVYPEIYQRFETLTQEAVKNGAPTDRAEQSVLYKMAGVATRETLGQEELAKTQEAATSQVPEPPTLPRLANAPPDGSVRQRAAQTFKMDPTNYMTKADRLLTEGP